MVELGELMYRYGIDGGLCPSNNRFKTRIEFGKHLKENSTADTCSKATRTGVNKNLFLTPRVVIRQPDFLTAGWQESVSHEI